MIFSKLFGRKAPPPPVRKFFPENRLEALLMQAANDPSTRPEFYKELLVADLFVLIAPGDHPYGNFVAQPGETLSIKGITVEGRKLIPVFTSERRLREYIQAQDSQARLNGRALLSMIATQNDGIVLNPASGYGKEFTSHEVISLVDGSIFQPRQQVLAKETKVLMGMPKEYPTEVVNALVRYFQGSSEVKKAYVAQIHMPDSGEPPHLIFSIQVDGDFRRLASDLGVVFQSILAADQFADLIQFGQGNLDDFFETQQPFFQR
ncbi:MAG TPA: enhanced serine sensitivity protein SseB C-terminal domain-containing protein [Anaerolineales bacterium]|nr:enhanced serine sensitivity protein SseB C-terminal domain-containing protein [Anaerolineales bacterium]